MISGNEQWSKIELVLLRAYIFFELGQKLVVMTVHQVLEVAQQLGFR